MKSKTPPSSGGYNPLTFFWVAIYNDGTALPQFDPDTGRENSRKLVDHTKLKAFGWFPFTRQLAQKILYTTYLKPNLPHYTIELHNGDELTEKSYRQIIKTFDYCKCGKCGFTWQFTPVPTDPVVGLLTSQLAHVEHIPVQTVKDKKIVKNIVEYVSAICPRCGYHDSNAVAIKDKVVTTHHGELRSTLYVLGVNDGPTLLIDEDGNVTVEA